MRSTHVVYVRQDDDTWRASRSWLKIRNAAKWASKFARNGQEAIIKSYGRDEYLPVTLPADAA